MWRNRPGVPLLLQDERTGRDGREGVSSQKDALHHRLHTHVRAALLSYIIKPALHHRSHSAPDVHPANANKAL